MRVSAKIDYACRALMDLSLRWPDPSPVPVQEIARRQKIPIKFLVHILISLKQLGFVESVRGKRGGYRLMKPPQEIKLSDVIKNFGGLGYAIGFDGNKKEPHQVMDSIWQEIDRTLWHMMEGINLETIANRQRSQGDAVIYEI